MEKCDDYNLKTKQILSAADIGHKVQRIACEILECYPDTTPAFVGIFKRGVTFAERVRAAVEAEKPEIPSGTLDINLYRDDFDNLGAMPTIESSDISFQVDGAHIILFDDVLFTGRTVRSAIGAIMDFGRPAKIELAALIDRGNRELPIQADYIGHEEETGSDEYIRVHFEENDGEDGIYLLRERGE